MEECQANIRAFEQLKQKIDRIGKEKITEIVKEHSGISAHKLICELLA